MATQHRNLHPTGWPILFCRPTQEPVSAKANAGKNRERLGKNADEWTGRQDRKSNGSRQKKKRDSKVESNDSTEIPYGGRHQTSPASLRGIINFCSIFNIWYKTIHFRNLIKYLDTIEANVQTSTLTAVNSSWEIPCRHQFIAAVPKTADLLLMAKAWKLCKVPNPSV